ncbi:hypothetical protein [Streptomyces sp. B21-101]|uniref:hypothetical protein n=1 Tax=Streptomyces sp. B21-101 TaxID=3039415 RepID=UPI002FF121B2
MVFEELGFEVGDALVGEAKVGPGAFKAFLQGLAGPGRHSVFKPVVHTFVGKAIGYAPANADVHYRNAIPPQYIESVAFPGDPAYDRLRGLPTA